MPAKVHGLKLSHAGFGQYEKTPDFVVIPSVDDMTEYRDYVRDTNPTLEFVDDTHPRHDRVSQADGRIPDQNDGIVVGWEENDGHVTLELIYFTT